MVCKIYQVVSLHTSWFRVVLYKMIFTSLVTVTAKFTHKELKTCGFVINIVPTDVLVLKNQARSNNSAD